MSTSSRVFKSSAFLLAIQIVQRSLGLISTLILARLLVPEDFGIVALVAIALQFFEVLADAGNKHYIIQKTEVTDADLNTAWTMNIGIKSVIAVLVVLTSPSIADFFDTADLTLALSVAVLALPISALRNPILMLMARELNYRPIFILGIWQKVISFTVVVGFALIYPSYWAIITGNLVAAIVMAFGSYRIDTFRPSLSLSQFAIQWNFSKWLILRGLVGFTRSQIDNLIVGKLYGSSQLGGYHLIRELATFPAISVIIPGSEPLQAAIAERKDHPYELAYRIRMSLFMMITLITPISLFMATYSELIVSVVLGPQWTEYENLLRPFTLFFFTFCLFALVSDAFVAIGQVRALFWFDLVSTVIIVGLLISFKEASLETMAWARGWLAVITTIALLVMLQKRTHYRLTRLITLTCLVLAPCMLTLWATSLVSQASFFDTALLNLALVTAVFGILVLCLLLLTCSITRGKFAEMGHLWDQGKELLSNLDEHIRKR